MSCADKNDDWKSRRRRFVEVEKDEDRTSESGDSKNEVNNRYS